MKISTKGRYALRMLLDLAEHGNGRCVSLQEIASRQGISKKYLEQIVPILNRGGLLKTNRGYQGGYMLSKRPDQYTAGEILRMTEGSLCPVPCLEEGASCDRGADCLTLPLWQGLYRTVTDYLDHVTLQDLLDQRQAQNVNDYMI